MARGDDDNLMNKLRQMSEEGIAGFFNEIMSNDRMRSSFGKAGERFMANKQSFDRNVEQMLDFVNIPSKKDVRDLKARLDHLSSQLLNLSIKLDRLLDHDQPMKPKPSIRRAKKSGCQAARMLRPISARSAIVRGSRPRSGATISTGARPEANRAARSAKLLRAF